MVKPLRDGPSSWGLTTTAKVYGSHQAAKPRYRQRKGCC